MPTVVIIGTTVVVIVTSTASSMYQAPSRLCWSRLSQAFPTNCTVEVLLFWRERKKKSLCASSLESSQLAEAQSATTGRGFQHLPASIF